MTPIIHSLADISDRYRVLYCDLWGCLHNGQTPFPQAVAALQAFRKTGGTVILVTNSPRPRGAVQQQLDAMGAPRDCYDDIASSGDAAQQAMALGDYGRKVYHIGPERDLPFFTDEDGQPYDIDRVSLDEAEGIVCTGLFDDRTETPQDYRLTILTGVNRGLKMLCANPDIVVDVGETRIYCAGAIAEAYREAGGQADYFGKPHLAIYRLARQRAEAIRGKVADDEVLAIGDGIHTDVQGAISEGLDCVFITGGLAAEETETGDGPPNQAKLDAFVSNAELQPTYAMGRLG